MGEARRRKLAGTYPAETAKGERVCSECRIPTPRYVALPDGKHRNCDAVRKWDAENRQRAIDAEAERQMTAALDTATR